MATEQRLKKFVQVLPSLPARDADGNIIPDQFTEKKTLWGWFFDRENYWTITETQAQLVALENKIIENIDWKETVATFADIARTYPNPKEGWTVSVSDTNTIYRYDVASATWIKIFESSTELASATRNGLMSIANFNKLAGIEDGANRYIHPTNHPASIITTDASNRFVSDVLINKWNALVTFPGFAGVGGDYGASPSAARYDHNHSTLDNIVKLNFAAADSDTAWIGINIPSGEETHLDFYLADNPEQDTFRWRFGATGNSGVVETLMELKSSGLYFKGNLVSLSGHRHAMSDIDGLSLDWSAITNKPATATRWADWSEVTGKPSTFTPAAHTHAMSDIDGLSLDWSAITNKPATATRWADWSEVTGKPSTFTPAAHNHDGSYVASAIRTTWNNTSVISNVVGQLAWRNYGNGHTIFDASAGLTPDGTSCDKKNSTSKWSENYPTLMGWNGSKTYGVRVDSSRVSDESNYATYAGRLISQGYGLNTYDVVSRFNVKADGRFRLQIEGNEDAKNYVDKVSVGHADYANSAGSAPASDVYGWAKAATKPAYSWGEISGKPGTFNSDWLNTNNSLVYGASGLQYFNSYNMPITDPTINCAPNNDWWHIIRMNHANGTGYYVDIASALNSNNICYRRITGGTQYGWYAFLTETNYTSYTVPKTGGTFTGYVDFIGGAGNSGSDMRFKTNVKKFSDVLERIKQLDIIDYSWDKKGEERDTFGLNAGQIKMLFPKIYHQRDDDDKTEWLEYDRTGVIALKGIQELQDKCDKYEKAFKLISEKLGLSLEDLGL